MTEGPSNLDVNKVKISDEDGDLSRSMTIKAKEAVRRGDLVRRNQKEQSHQQAKKERKEKESTANSRQTQKNESVVGAGVPAQLHEERVIARARRRVCTPNSTSETSLMNAVTLVLPVDVVSKSFQEMVKTALKPQNAAQPTFGPSLHSSARRTSTTMRCGGCP